MKNLIPIVIALLSAINLSAKNIQTSDEDVIHSNQENNPAQYSSYPLSDLSAKNTSGNGNSPVLNAAGQDWNLYFTMPGKVFKDVYFVNKDVGYIVSELGGVFKTTNGGMNWTTVLNLGFPYYWYGVYALSPDTLVISGFDNSTGGVIRWSFTGGADWGSFFSFSPWLDAIHFFNKDTGVVFAFNNGGIYYTTNGGLTSSSWHYVQVNSDMGWFGGNRDFQSNGRIYATGIHFDVSTNFGIKWTTSPSADNVFDGGVDFLDHNNNYGWTGGGQISSPVSGWVHRTTDGGASWSGRLHTFAFPIRALRFFNTTFGIACGGNVHSEVGGIFSTTDGGLNWNEDVNTSAEMFAMNVVAAGTDSIDIWCVGSTGGTTGFTGKAYKTRIKKPEIGSSGIIDDVSATGFYLYQNYPNPFNPSTTIHYELSKAEYVRLKVFDILGNEIETLVDQKQHEGNYEIFFDGSKHASGIYFYSLETSNHKETRRMMLLK